MPKTVILLRSPKPDEYGLLDSAGEIYTIDEKLSCLKGKRYEFIQPAPDDHYFDKAFELIKKFAHRTYGGKKLVEHLMHNGESLFYFTRFILINRFTPALKEQMLLEKILDQLPQDIGGDIDVLHTSPYTVHYEKRKHLRFHTRGTVKAGKLNKRGFYVLFLIRAFVGMVLNPLKRKTKHLFLFPQVEPQPLLDRKTLEMKQGNPITDYFLEDLLEQKGTFILEERFPVNEGSFELNSQNIFGRYGRQGIFFEPYLLRSMLLMLKGKQMERLSTNEKTLFNAIMSEEEDPHLRLLNHIHRDLRPLRKLGVIRMHAANYFFKNRKVQTVGCIDEYSVKSRSVLDAAIVNQIHTYAIQHGVIHPRHMGYSLLPEDQKYTRFVNQMFVYGKYIRDLLIEQNYAVDEIHVTGQLRTDIIPVLKENHQKIQVEGISNDKPLILYTSQPVASVHPSDLRDTINRDFMALSKEFPGYQFVLKPHPRETDHSYFYQLASEVQTGDFVVSNADLYLLLSKCSMLLTHCSSVGQEAVNFDKPLVVQDYPDIDIMNYIRDGIGFKTTNYEELRNVVGAVLKGELRHDKEAYKMYRERLYGPIDGKTSARILAHVFNSRP